MIGRILTTVALVLAMPAPAQELDTSQLQQHADTVRQDSLSRSLLRQRSGTAANPARTFAEKRARAQATCANKERAAAIGGPDNPKVRELYRLCGLLGF